MRIYFASLILLSLAPGVALEPWGQLGAVAVLGGSFILVLKWLMTQFQKALDKNTAHLAMVQMLIVGLQKQLLTHDLTVSGVNPNAGADIDERTNRAYAKYTELYATLEEIRRLIKSELERLN